jgi:hypothetical protein
VSVFTKLNLKDQDPIVVLDAPESFEPEVADLDRVTVHRSFAGAGTVDFAIGFGTTLDQVEAFAAGVEQHTAGDAVVWFAYPKKSSKRYTCEFNRDTGWESLGEAGFEPVRQVAIDADWSALRFRRVEFVKTMTRDASGALTEAGKRRTRDR